MQICRPVISYPFIPSSLSFSPPLIFPSLSRSSPGFPLPSRRPIVPGRIIARYRHGNCPESPCHRGNAAWQHRRVGRRGLLGPSVPGSLELAPPMISACSSSSELAAFHFECRDADWCIIHDDSRSRLVFRYYSAILPLSVCFLRSWMHGTEFSLASVSFCKGVSSLYVS